MQREIKFRCWDVKEKKMFVPAGILNNTICCVPEDDDEQFFVHMQFTGLKDKNGKEIYEGDIVRILYTDWISKSDDDPRTIEKYLFDLSKIGKIVFDGDRYCIAIYNSLYNEWRMSSIYSGQHGFIEIIGNVYQNFDLMPYMALQARGIQYGDINYLEGTEKERFIKMCEFSNVKWLNEELWQSIDTAPKKGEILIYDYGSDSMYIGYWNSSMGNGCWNAAGVNNYIPRPTHWMPLPEKPRL